MILRWTWNPLRWRVYLCRPWPTVPFGELQIGPLEVWWEVSGLEVRYPHDSAAECLAADCGTCAPNPPGPIEREENDA